ncbi:hypothetical protein BJ741DRAFT_594649 [Chytriomyces cf. hyalinus JEL632]|nr:hypothetical protein BJ741DRAFT_594649 [Chytriomyces cf. hyalinus JEL632]
MGSWQGLSVEIAVMLRCWWWGRLVMRFCCCCCLWTVVDVAEEVGWRRCSGGTWVWHGGVVLSECERTLPVGCRWLALVLC